MSTHYLSIAVLALSCVASTPQAPNLTLDINTKAGVQTSGISVPAGDLLSLDLGAGVRLLIPWQVVKEAVAEKELHAVTLLDGSRYVGQIRTTVYAPDGKTYPLAKSANFRVGKLESSASRDNSPDKREIMTVHIDFLTQPFSIARFQGFHGVERVAKLSLKRLDGDIFADGNWDLSFGHTANRDYGETFQAEVGGERLNRKLSLCEKFVLSKAKEKDQWRLILQAPGEKEMEGRFLPANESDRPTLESWSMKFETTNGCTLVATEPSCTISISMKHGPAQSPAQRAIVPGATVVVCEDGARFMLGEKVIAELPQQTELEVTQIRDDWVGGYGEVEGKRMSGWVKRDQVRSL